MELFSNTHCPRDYKRHFQTRSHLKNILLDPLHFMGHGVVFSLLILSCFLLGAATHAILPFGKPWVTSSCPRGSNFLCLTDFPRVKLPRGNFHGYVKKNKKNAYHSSRGNFFEFITLGNLSACNHKHEIDQNPE